jgi:hypothetical protein
MKHDEEVFGNTHNTLWDTFTVKVGQEINVVEV